MNFLSPWWLMGLPVVGAVALLTIRQRDRRVVIVSSVKFWLTVGGDADGSSDKRRRITASWICLLLGATMGVLALGEPVWKSPAPVRYVRLELAPSVEIATQTGMNTLRSSTEALLDRLDSNDRVQIVLPISAGGGADWIGLREARKKLQTIEPLPIRAADLIFPPTSAKVQHTYRITPAGANHPDGPRLTQIEIPSDIPTISIDALGAKIQPDGKVQVFASLRNNSSKSWGGDVVIQPIDSDENGALKIPIRVEPSKSVTVIRSMAPAKAYRISVGEIQAWLARYDSRRVRVAMLGRDGPTLRRYILADPLLELWGRAGDAHLVIANGVEPPAGLPAFIINPPKPPPGWRNAGELKNIVPDRADISAGDAILQGVALGGMAIRRARPWLADRDENPPGIPLISIDGETLLLRTAPGRSAAPGSRRVYTAFDIFAENTNIEAEDAFVVLLANIFRWLARGDSTDPAVTYSYKTPLQTVGETGLKVVTGGRPDWLKAGGPHRPKFLWGGLYRDETDLLHAVNLLGVAFEKPTRPANHAIADAPLPDPVESDLGWAVWPWLIILTMVFWLVGWVLRVR